MPDIKKKKKALAPAEMLRFFSELGILKKVPRTGWLWRNIPDCESIADHCFRVNLIAMFLCDMANVSSVGAKKRFDAGKVMRMAILHEIAECRVGDIPYPALKYIGSDRKKKAESEAVSDMMTIFAGASGVDYTAIWNEFEEARSAEAKLVKAADKIEMLLQALEYERAGAATLGDFWRNRETRSQIAFTPELESIYDALHEMHKKAAPDCQGKNTGIAAAGKRKK